MTLEELKILITAETKDLREELKRVRGSLGEVERTTQTTAKSMKNAFKAVAVALAALGIFKYVKDGVEAASQLEGAMLGLQSIIEGQGRSFAGAKKFINEYISDGLVPLTNAVTAYKNLASRGYDDKQIQDVMSRLKDSAAFGRQASYSLGEAVSSATEGLKNENSILVDNAGVTKNVAKMWEDYAKSIGKSTNNLSKQEKIQAEVSGIMEETKFQVGDAAKYTDTYAGRIAALSKTFSDIHVNIGQAFIPIITVVLPYLQSLANAISRVTALIASFVRALFGVKGSQSAGGSTADKAAGSQDKLGTSLDKTADKAKKAAKEAKNAVAGFDEINQLPDPSAKAAADSPDSAASPGLDTLDIPGIDTETIPAEVQAMVDKVKGILEKGKSVFGVFSDGASKYGEQIKTAFSGMGPALQPLVDMKEPIMSSLNEIGQTFSDLTTGFIKPAADYLLLDFIPNVVTSFTESFAPVFADLITSAVEGFSKTFANETAIVSDLLLNTWIPSADQLKVAFQEAFPLIAESAQSLLDNTIKPLADFMVNGFILPICQSIQETFVPIFSDVAVWAIGQFATQFQWTANLLNDVYQTLIAPVFELLKKIVMDTLEIVRGLWEKHGETILKNVGDMIQGVRDRFQQLWDKILKPIIEPFLVMLSELWDKHLKAIVVQLGEFYTQLINGALEILNKFITPIITYLIDMLAPGFVKAFNAITLVVGTAIGAIADVIKSLIKILGGIVDFIVGVLTGNWGKAWNGIVEVFTGIVDLIGGIFKGVLNIVIDVINLAVDGVLSSINGLIQGAISLINNVPGVNIKLEPIKAPKIPKLAKGGITNGEMLATIGDNPGGREVVSPLGDLMDMIQSAVATAVLTASQMVGGNSSQQAGDVVLQVDGVTIARLLGPYMSNESARIGGSMIMAK